MAASNLTSESLMSGYQDLDHESPPAPPIRNCVERFFAHEQEPHFTTVRSFNHDPWNTPAQPWPAERQALRSLVSGEELILGHPCEGMMARRREWDRQTDRGRNVDYSWNGSIENELRHRWWSEANAAWIEDREFEPFAREDFGPVHWDQPATRLWEPISPKWVPPQDPNIDPFNGDTDTLASFTSILNGKSYREVMQPLDSKWSISSASSRVPSSGDSPTSDESYQSFIDWFYSREGRIAKARAEDNDTQSSIADIDDEEPVICDAAIAVVVPASNIAAPACKHEEPTFGVATTAAVMSGPRIPVPARGPSLMHLKILETGLASKSRRVGSTPETLVRDISDGLAKKSQPTISEAAEDSASGAYVVRASKFTAVFSDEDVDSNKGQNAEGGFWSHMKRCFSCV